MTTDLDRFRDVLAAVGPAPDARELSEILWLACHVPGAAETPEPVSPVPSEPPVAPVAEQPSPPPPVPDVPPPTALHPRPAAEAAPGGSAAAEILVPTAPMLADPRGVQRALRPLKRRVPSRHRLELDEDATAARIADTRRWTPVLVPAPERWLTLSLVVDGGPSMRLWRPLARELTEVLVRQGAFQDVHVSHLDTTGRVSGAPEAPPRDPATLLDPSGRHAVLVLTDCSGPHWWDGRAARSVRRWARAGPTAILQPLPERLWRRTAAPVTPGLAVLPRPGAPNTDLRFTPYDGDAAPGVPVPVLEVAPHWFAAWAHLVSGGGPRPAAITTLAPRPPGGAPVRRERGLPVAERVHRFLAAASPAAAELAAHVAVSVPSLPVMRLIQHRVLGGSGPGQLAEVLLSGLLRPVGGVHYEFVPGAREALLDTLPRPEALHTRDVLEAVSAEIERLAGTSAETFRALLPRDGGPVTLTADTDHFALVTPRTRAVLTPEPRPPDEPPDPPGLCGLPLDELIGDGWDRPPHPTPIGVDDNGEKVWIDVLRGVFPAPHGQVIESSGGDRDRLLETIILGLTLNHSPRVVALAFVAPPTPDPYFHFPLDALPHVMDGPVTASTLEAELLRRRALLDEAGLDGWDAYQAAIASGRPLAPLPALVLVVDATGRPPGIEPGELLARLGSDIDLGLRPVLLSSARTTTPAPRWEITSVRDGRATLRHDGLDGTRPFHLARRMPRGELIALRSRMSDRWDTSHDRPQAAGGPTLLGHEFDPLAPSARMPHGLVVGETEARQRVVREIVAELAAHHSPADLGIVFAGFGEHPLGEPDDLPHRRHTYEELLGAPNRMREFLTFLAAEMRSRTAARPSRRLLVVADLSLTFPPSRRDAAEALLSLAQRGEPLGVHLLLSSTMVERTTIWSRFLPLLQWRVAATRLPPAALQQVMGRATLPFPNDHTAYLLTPGAPPRPFEVQGAPAEPVRPPRLDPVSSQGVPPPFRSALRAIESRLIAREGRLSEPPHTIFEGPFAPDREAAAKAYGKMLSDLGVVSEERVMLASWTVLKGWLSGAPDAAPTRWPGMLLVHDADLMTPTADSRYVDMLAAQMDENDDLVVVLCGGPGLLRALSERRPRFTRRFAGIVARATFGPVSSGPADRTELPPVPGRRLPLGLEHGDRDEPVVLDLDVHPHLLITGSAGTGGTAVTQRVLGELMNRLPTDDKPLYLIDRPPGSREPLGGSDRYLRHARTREEAAALMDEVAERVRNRGPSRTAETYLVIARHDGRTQDALMRSLVPLLEDSHQTGFHLVVTHSQTTLGSRSEPLLRKLRELGTPAVMTGACAGWEADAWGVPSPAEPLPHGWAVVARPGDRPKIVQLVT